MSAAERRALDPALLGFAEEVGTEGPVTVVGSRTRWDVGGTPAPGTREVSAPAGIRAFEPAEMTVRVGAGTPLAELDAALAEHGQEVALSGTASSTVGGAVAVGWDSLRRGRVGLARDAVLQVRYVSAEGRVVTAGGPTVKNVAGYDLCRLLTGSLGTLGLVGEVIVRTRPRPPASRWLSGEADPFGLRRALYRPSAVLWDGTRTWVLLEGQRADVEDQARIAAELGCAEEVEGPPELPPHRWALKPSELPALPDDPRLQGERFVAEVGVGLVHASCAGAPAVVDPGVRALAQRVKQSFDPEGRLSPGRDLFAARGAR